MTRGFTAGDVMGLMPRPSRQRLHRASASRCISSCACIVVVGAARDFTFADTLRIEPVFLCDIASRRRIVLLVVAIAANLSL
jgi:hypothetical protein